MVSPLRHWPAGMNYYQADRQRPFARPRLPAMSAPTSWGPLGSNSLLADTGILREPPVASFMGIRATQGAGRCHPARDAGQTEAEAYRQQIAPTAPKYFKAYLLAGQDAPEPGSREYNTNIRPHFVSRSHEQTYVDWWYSHYTTDGPHYRIPEPQAPPARHVPAGPTQAAPPAPTYTVQTTGETIEEVEQPYGELTVTAQPEGPAAEAPRRTPWGWIIGSSAIVLLVGGGAVYVYATRPKRRGRG